MKKAKKWIALMVALVLVFALAACGTPSTEDPADSEDTSSEDAASADTSEDAASADDSADDAAADDSADAGDASSEDTSSSGEGLKIGIASRQITNDFDRDIISYAKAAVEAAGGTVTVTDGGADPIKHGENIQNMINSGIDGLIIITGDPTQITPLVAKANEKGIEVVTANFPECMEGVITNVNGDNELLAALAADSFLAAIGYKGDTWFVQVAGEPVLTTRERVFRAMAEDFPNVTVTTINAEHNAAKVQTQIEEVLAANPDEGSIAGIYGSYDLLISAGVEAVRQAGRSEIKMLSIDGDFIAFQELLAENSPFVATVVQDVPSIGTQAGEILLGAIEGSIKKGDVPDMTLVSCYVATRNNVVAAAEKRWGEGFWERSGYDKAEVESLYPQTQELVTVTAVVPK